MLGGVLRGVLEGVLGGGYGGFGRGGIGRGVRVRGRGYTKVAALWSAGLSHERGATNWSERVLASILRADLNWTALLEIIQECDGILRREVFKEEVVHLDHWSVDAGAEALYFRECPRAALGGLSHLDVEMRLNGVHNVVSAADHARRGGA